MISSVNYYISQAIILDHYAWCRYLWLVKMIRYIPFLDKTKSTGFSAYSLSCAFILDHR